MTTIVYRDGVMAADSRAYSGDRKPIGSKQKIHRLPDGSLIGVSSSKVGEAERFRRMVSEKGVDADFETEVPVQAIVVMPNGGIFYFNDERSFSGPISAEFICIGSGEVAAHAALLSGCSPVKAVEVAMQLDVWTGGDVRTLELEVAK